LALKIADVNLPYTFVVESLGEVVSEDLLNFRKELIEYFDGTARRHRAINGSVSVIVDSGPTQRIPLELLREWPEVVEVFAKLLRGERLDKRDELWIREVAEATGWSMNDVVEEFRNLDVDPLERVERYRSIFESYYREAFVHKERGDTKQAGEKMWGAVTALVKLYAAAKDIFISHWSLGKLYSFVENNVEERYRDIFVDLLNETYVLHIHFYEGHMGPTAFERQWKKVVELIEKARQIVLKSLAKAGI